MRMKTLHKKFIKVTDVINDKDGCSLPLEITPNSMGINLCSVDFISWLEQDDGQLVSLTINFLPENEENNK